MGHRLRVADSRELLREKEPLTPFETGTPAAAARQPAGKYAATEAWVYLLADTDVSQRRVL